MIIATIDPTISHELPFDIDIQGSRNSPEDVRFIIEAQVDPKTGETVQDVFSIICRAIRTDTGVKVIIPRLLNLFKSGSYKAKLEVVLEGRLFTPVDEEIEIAEPINIFVSPKINESKSDKVIAKPAQPIQNKEHKKIVIKAQKVDNSWREKGFSGIENPFKPLDI
jgi:hypothetical protein